jgi:hypothetical protein
MIDEQEIDAALRPQPDIDATPFFARRVMHAIRQPQPLVFPWRRLIVAGCAAVVATALTAFAAPDVDAVACAAIAVAALVTAGLEPVIARHG